MTVLAAKIVWFLGVVAWTAIRLPYRARARKERTVADRKSAREWTALGATIVGLVVIPMVYAVFDAFDFADRPFVEGVAWLGVAVQVLFVWLFWRSHKDLGRQWSVTLEIREGHRLVTEGVFARVRHPMYSSFWCWAIAQALLLPNWLAGLSGLATIAWLYFSRIEDEEAMMRETFGAEYDAYAARTGRLIPRLGR